MKENYYLDDGTYSASQIVIVMVKRHLEGLGKDIYGSLLADLKEPIESSEFRLKLKVSIYMKSMPEPVPNRLPWARSLLAAQKEPAEACKLRLSLKGGRYRGRREYGGATGSGWESSFWMGEQVDADVWSVCQVCASAGE